MHTYQNRLADIDEMIIIAIITFVLREFEANKVLFVLSVVLICEFGRFYFMRLVPKKKKVFPHSVGPLAIEKSITKALDSESIGPILSFFPHTCEAIIGQESAQKR